MTTKEILNQLEQSNRKKTKQIRSLKRRNKQASKENNRLRGIINQSFDLLPSKLNKNL